jgi:uncharacterized protein YcnI
MNASRISALAVALLVALGTGRAGAHVTLAPRSVPPGGTVDFTIRCPDESGTASTVKLVVQLPVDTRLADVRVPAVPGWRSSTTMRDGAVDTVTWEGGAIRPHEVGYFHLVATVPATPGPLPFKAVQTYDDGNVVRWIDARAPGEPEPPFPTPIVEVR